MRLTFLLFDGFGALDVVGCYEVLAKFPEIELEFAAGTKVDVATDTGRLGSHAYHRLEQLKSTDVLYVPGGPGVFAALDNQPLIDCIRRLHAACQRVVSIRNGVRLLASTELLSGRRTTAYRLERPKVRAYGAVAERARFLCHGKLVSFAGASASFDAGGFLAGLLAGERPPRLSLTGIDLFPESPIGDGNIHDQRQAARSVIRHIKQVSVRRLAGRQFPF